MNKNLALVLLSVFGDKKREDNKIFINKVSDDNSSNIWSNNLINLNVANFIRLGLNVEHVIEYWLVLKI